MESYPMTAIEKLLDDLANGGLAMVRREAAEKLGRLPESDEHIVCALLVAKMADSRPEVRDAASRSLAAPVHCAILEQHPDVTVKATEAIAQRAQRQRDGDEQIMREFNRRRKRTIIRSLFILGLSATALLFWIIGLRESARIATVLNFVWLAALLTLLWVDWRCPACDASLKVSVFRIPNPFFCPHCGTRLR